MTWGFKRGIPNSSVLGDRMGFPNLSVGGSTVGTPCVTYSGTIVVLPDASVTGFPYTSVFGTRMGFLNSSVFGYMMYGLPKISVGGEGVGLVWVMYCGTKDTVSPKSSVTGLWNWSVNGAKIG